MKQILLIITVCAMYAFPCTAQSGVVATRRVLQSMPAMAKTDTLIELEKLRYQEGYVRMLQAAQAIKRKLDSLEQQPAALQAVAQAAAADTRDSLQQTEKALQEYLDVSGKKLQEYAQLLQQPYYDKVREAIKAVALRRKLTTVAEAGGLLYVSPAADITQEVIRELSQR